MTISVLLADQSLDLVLGDGHSTTDMTASVIIGLSSTAPAANGTGITEPNAYAQLSSALSTAAAITALPVTATTAAIVSGDNIVVTSGANTQTFVASGAVAQGGTSIPVNSATPTFAFPSGSFVQDTTQGNGYARVSVANTTANWPAAANGSKSNGTTITFPTATSTTNANGWGTVDYWFLLDANGVFKLAGQLSSAVSITTGSTPSFAASGLTITLS